MASGESFDPRTWKGGDSAPGATPVTKVAPAAPPPPVPTSPGVVAGAKFRWWLGPALSAAILAGGALAAYETRGDGPAEAAPALTQ